MSALSIQVPFPVFQDRDGQPLDNGYVWIGVANLNPQTNPVVAYYDAALTIEAAQPLRTINGYISNAGTPAQIYVDGINFSILVLDSKGSMVYNFPDGTGISPNAAGIIYDPAGTGAVQTTVQAKLRESVSVKDFGALGDGTTDDTAAFNAAVAYANGALIYIPQGTYRVSGVTGSDAYFCGDGAEKSIVQLATTNTASIFQIDNLRLDNIGFSDRGRSSLNHTTNGAVFLFICTDAFRADNCIFLTDRSVLSQTPTANGKWAIVTQSSVERVNLPVVNEIDTMNIFTLFTGIPYIYFNGVTFNELVCRSTIDAEYTQTTIGEMKPVVAFVENCRFNYIHNSGTGNEVKVVFLQGYTSSVCNNTFTDCFGRHIDFLGNYDTALTNGIFQPNIAENNKIGYTTARQAATGFNNSEAGSIYCRYADVTIIGNILDFTNLLLSSATYSAIVVRHGYKNALISGNTIISAKAYGIVADISDLIDTDFCSVSIINNNVNSIRATRKPIAIINNSAAKIFSNVIVNDNTITYTSSSAGIVFDSDPARATSFSFENIVAKGNWNVSYNSLDDISFQAFPISLDTPNSSVVITVNPAGTNLAGVITSLSNAISCASTYYCKALTIQLASTVTTTQTLTGPVTITPAAKITTIDGDNGFLGRIKFYTVGTQQINLYLFNLTNNIVVLDGCMLESDSAASTTSLVLATGYGEIIGKNCDFRYGEYAIDTRGPNISVKAGTINNINLGAAGSNGIFYALSDKLVSISIEGTTGASNTRLYNLDSPAVLMYQNIAVGTTAGLKTFTLVV